MINKTVQTPSGLGQGARLAFLLKDSVLYGGAVAISKAFALITFPLLARQFTVAEYGVVDYFLVLASFLAVLFIFGQDSAVARYFYEYEDIAERRQVISQSLIFQLTGLGLLLPLLWLGSGWITPLLVETSGADGLLKLVLLQLPFLLLINFSQNLLKWTFSRTKFLTMSLGFTLVQASLLVFAVLVLDIGVQGVLVVGLCTSMVFGLLGLFFVRGWLARPRSFNRLREMLPYAIPYGVICVLGAFSPTLERSLTDQLLGSDELGLYAVGTKIAMLIGLVVNAFQTAWGPFSLSLYKQQDAGQTYNWVFKLFALGLCLIALLLTLVALPVIHLLASERYFGAVVVVFPLTMGLAIQATSWITEIGISISKRSYLNLYAYVIFVAATLAGILLLVPVFGLIGVALGVLIGQFVKAIVSSWLAQRAYPLPWHYWPVIVIFLLTLLVGFAGEVGLRKGSHSIQSLILIFGMVVVGVVGWWLLFQPPERNRMRNWLGARFSLLLARAGL